MDEDAVHVLFLARSDWTIVDEKLGCFLTTSAEHEAATSKYNNLEFNLDAETDKTCKELFRFTKSKIRRFNLHAVIDETGRWNMPSSPLPDATTPVLWSP